MKKYYFIVLTALLTFALNLNAQENEEQETYNMTVTLPDGTTVTVNTEDVNEITFANGKLNVTGTSIDEIVQKLRQALDAIAENRNRFYDVLERSVKAQESADAAQTSADAAQASAAVAQASADMAIMEAREAIMEARDADDRSVRVLQSVAELENRVSNNDENVQTINTQLVLLANMNNYLDAKVTTLEAENFALKNLLNEMSNHNLQLEARLAALEEIVNSMKE